MTVLLLLAAAAAAAAFLIVAVCELEIFSVFDEKWRLLLGTWRLSREVSRISLGVAELEVFIALTNKLPVQCH